MNKLMTIWGETLDRNAPLPEYPRPQLRREKWLNLNGVWRYTLRKSDSAADKRSGEIVVPFAPESPLSGVERQLLPGEILWYERTFTLPADWAGMRVLLHFGAVDQIADVSVNGQSAAHHEGGYLPFSADITALLRPGENALCVRVTDSLTDTPHAYGKQKYDRGGIWYTATSGIWQTVWLECAAENYVEELTLTPDFDARLLRWRIKAQNPAGANVVVRCEGEVIAEDWAEEDGSGTSLIRPEAFRPWSPEEPFLYDVTVTLPGGDRVESYFALRKFGTVYHEGRTVLALNGKPYFQNGLLDQGYWSDGYYTAPSDAAMIYDIETAKELGFNMLRKHIKIEPMRWYYHCDRLGMLVWQDMVSGGGPYRLLTISAPLFTGRHQRDDRYDRFGRVDRAGREQFERDLKYTVRQLYNCPCIALWTVFNEGWGQFDSLRLTGELRRLDPTRLIDHASGWHDQGGSDLRSYHIYFKPLRMRHDGKRALALTEFGGYTLPMEGHIWNKKFGYRSFQSAAKWMDAYVRLYEKQVLPLIKAEGLSAAVYTQLSDVEDELNGLFTYDRRICKADPAVLRRLSEHLRF